MESKGNTRGTTFLRRLSPVLLAVLFAAFPLLSLFQQNQSEVELSVLWRPLALCVAAAVALYAVFLLVVKRNPKAGLLASLVLVTFFYYGIFAGYVGLRDRWFLPLWLALALLGIVALVRTPRDLGNVTLVAGVGALVLVVGPLARIVSYQVNHPAISVSDPRRRRRHGARLRSRPHLSRDN